jgi:RHS repeat-associated protein
MPGDTLSLVYDGTGNRSSRTDNGQTTTYGYATASHRLQTATNASLGRTFATNAVGNIDAWTGADGVQNAMSYDAYQRPATHTKNANVTRYRFNALGQRVMKSQAGGSLNVRYIYAGQNKLLAERASNTTTNASQWTSYLWLGGQPVGLVKGGTLYWVSADHLGRPEIVTDAAKQVVWRAENRAFDRGVVLDQIGGYNLGFPGQYHDAESGLAHNGFRDYEPTLGRYIQSDPIGLAGGISTYSYAMNSPVTLVDELGLDATVCLYSGAGGFGHVGIGVNSPVNVTAGYYPREGGDGNAISGTPGVLRIDNNANRQRCVVIRTTPEQDQRMIARMREVAQNPGTYALTGNNCVAFVRSVLREAGINTSDSIRPRPFFNALPGN